MITARGPFRRLLNPWMAILVSAVAGAILLGSLHTQGPFFRGDLILYFTGLIPLVLWQVMTMRNRDGDRLPAHALVAATPALLLLAFAMLSTVCSTTEYDYYYFSHWLPSPKEPWWVGVRLFAISWTLLTPFLLRSRATYRTLLTLLMVAAMGCAYFGFQQGTAGQPINNFDHSAMIFRIWQFAQSFPQLTNYVPAWNGGIIDTSGTMSGVAGLGLAAWPFWQLPDLMATYTQVFQIFFTLGLPLLAAASLLMIGARWEAACIAAILTLSPSREFSLWTIQHGTATASFAMSFSLPFSACLFRIVWLRDRRWRVLIPTILSGFLLLIWPPNFFVAAGIGLSILISRRVWRWSTWARLGLVGLVLGLLLLKWVLTLLFDAQESTDFLMKKEHIGLVGAKVSATGVLAGGRELLESYLSGTQPFIAFLGILGGILAAPRSIRRWFGTQVMVMIAIVLFSLQFPNLQLWRFINLAVLLAVAPAAILVHRILRLRDRRLALVRSALFGLLLVTILQVYNLFAHKTSIHYVTLHSPLTELMAFFKAKDTPPGRVMFVGRNNAHFGHSWVACLPILADREMMGSDYYNFPPGFKDVSDYPPLPFRETDDGVRLFAETYNVRYIVAHHENWFERLSTNTQWVTRVTSEPAFLGYRFALFETRFPDSWFLEGDGSVDARCNALDVRVDPGTSEGVLKYTWQEGLQSEDKAVDIYPHEESPGITLIGFRTRGPKQFRIVYNNR